MGLLSVTRGRWPLFLKWDWPKTYFSVVEPRSIVVIPYSYEQVPSVSVISIPQVHNMFSSHASGIVAYYQSIQDRMPGFTV